MTLLLQFVNIKNVSFQKNKNKIVLDLEHKCFQMLKIVSMHMPVSHSQVEEKTSRNVQQILKSQFLSSVLELAFSKWSGTIMFYLGGDVIYAKGWLQLFIAKLMSNHNMKSLLRRT